VLVAATAGAALPLHSDDAVAMADVLVTTAVEEADADDVAVAAAALRLLATTRADVSTHVSRLLSGSGGASDAAAAVCAARLATALLPWRRTLFVPSLRAQTLVFAMDSLMLLAPLSCAGRLWAPASAARVVAALMLSVAETLLACSSEEQLAAALRTSRSLRSVTPAALQRCLMSLPVPH
jgi:hypothetical protein